MKIYTNKLLITLLCLVFFNKVELAQVSITSPTASVCQALAVDGTAPAWSTLGNIVITETAKSDFPKKTGSVTISAPTGWVFNTAVTPTITGPGGNIAGNIAITSVASGAITFTWSAGGTNAFDVVTISGIQFQASSTGSADGPVYCSTSTQAIVGLTAGVQGTGSQLAYLSQIKLANAGSYQTICSTSATMAANSPTTGASQVWSFVSGPVTPSFANVNSPTTNVTGMTTNGVYTLKWTATTACGTSSSNVVITKTVTPTSNAGPDQTFCYPNSAILAANFPSYGTGTWSILAGSPSTSTAQISDVNDEGGSFTPTASGTYTLQWSITLSGCTTNTDNVVFTVSPGPNASSAGPSRTVCAGTATTLAANTPSATCTGAWSVVSGPSTLMSQFSASTSPTSNFTAAGGSGTYILAWTITKTSNGCSSVSNTTITVNPGPTTSAAGPDQTVCTTATLAGNTPAVGTGSWTVISGAGVFSNPTSPFSTYTPSSQNVANTIRWTISSAGCSSSTDDVVITATCIPTTTLSIPSNSTTTIVGLTGCPSTKVLTDPAGASADYAANSLGTVTFTAPAGTCMSYSFSSFSTESSYDELTLTVGSTTLGVYSGSSIPPSGVTSSNTLTVRFESDGSVQYPGFVMSVSCANACSAGSLSGGLAAATPSLRCSNYTTTLSVSGGSTSDCGITYQWESSNNGTSGWSNITGATASSTTAAISGTKYFRCKVTCGGTSVYSSTVSAGLQAGGCGCPTSITLPYSTTGQTTCGMGDDITSSNVTAVCGSSSYYTGEDVVYTFTPTATGNITIDLASSGSYTGLMLYKGCPTSAGSTCVTNSQSYTGNKSACATVTAGVAYYLVIDSYASPTCNPYDLTISAPTGTTVACNMAYTASSTTYSFETFSGTVLPTTDDVLFNSTVNFGFTICYDGQPYTGGYIASNAALVFDAVQCFPNVNASTIASGGASTGYTIPNPAPVNSTSIPRNAILAPWHDINPSLGGTIQYATLGTAPNRRFIVSYENVPMFSCGTSSPTIYFSSQIKVFETSNTIEIHVKKKGVCGSWNNGQAVLGLHNYNGTTYIPPTGSSTAYNAVASPGPYNQWTMTNTAYKFTTSCGSSGACAVVLPITMKSFYGERVNKVNHLYWETASEENLKKFKVERSLDGINFTGIGEVDPKNSAAKYQFEDYNAAPGMINYYRIAISENDNTVNYTNIYPLSSDNEEVLTVSQIYPNPTNTSFAIAIESKQKGSAVINIFDMYGKCVRSSQHEINGGVNQYSEDISELRQGIYFVEVLNSFNEIITKQKLIKQ